MLYKSGDVFAVNVGLVSRLHLTATELCSGNQTHLGTGKEAAHCLLNMKNSNAHRRNYTGNYPGCHSQITTHMFPRATPPHVTLLPALLSNVWQQSKAAEEEEEEEEGEEEEEEEEVIREWKARGRKKKQVIRNSQCWGCKRREERIRGGGESQGGQPGRERRWGRNGRKWIQ